MEYVVLIVFVLFAIFAVPAVCNAQSNSKVSYNESTKTYSASAVRDSDGNGYTITPYFYEVKGINYKICMSNRGACFIIRTSKKTGKDYRMYLPKDVQESVRKQMNFSKKK